jgi:hypothetical protein
VAEAFATTMLRVTSTPHLSQTIAFVANFFILPQAHSQSLSGPKISRRRDRLSPASGCIVDGFRPSDLAATIRDFSSGEAEFEAQSVKITGFY